MRPSESGGRLPALPPFKSKLVGIFGQIAPEPLHKQGASCRGDILGTRGSKSGQNSAKWGTGDAVAVNKNNKLRLRPKLRTKGSWVQILPGVPFSQGLAETQALFIFDFLQFATLFHNPELEIVESISSILVPLAVAVEFPRITLPLSPPRGMKKTRAAAQ